MTTAWSTLPNAALIDWVMADVKERPQVWTAARDATRTAAWDAVLDAAWGAAWDAAWTAAWGTIIALTAWDDCAELLDLPTDAFKFLAMNGHHPAVLLYPMKLVKEMK